MQQFLVEAVDWLLGEGSGVLAALILGGLGVLALWIWKKVGPKIEESRLMGEIEALRQETERLKVDALRLTDQLEGRAAEAADLRDTIRTLSTDLQETRDRAAAARLSEQAHLRNLELLKSAIDDAMREAGETGPASPEVLASLHTLAERLLVDTFRQILAGLSPQNYATSKKRLETIFEFCARHGVPFPPERQEQLVEQLREEYKTVVRKAAEREEQARIKAQIREEAREAAENERRIREMEAQQRAMEEAIARALARTHDEHSREVEDLRAQLEELKEKERAMSQAQLTKAGHVYVISNIGSFGEGVFKVGMTRRLDPLDRIRELGDASVPFPFDVHMMISCTDAPALENALHRELHKLRVNRVNPRKEFFRIDLNALIQIIERHHGRVEYMATPEALEYRESQNLSGEDAEFVEGVLETVGGEEGE